MTNSGALQRFFIEIKYFGKPYNGWQIQPDKVTVQSTLDEGLQTIFNQSFRTIGCGRTDSGVHASQFFVHFDAEPPVPENFIYRINKYLPPSIFVKQILPVHPDAHARYDATYRAYDYYCHFEKNPFLRELSFFYPWIPLDIEKMRIAFDMMNRFTDFRAFCKTGGAQKHYLCNMYKTQIDYNPTEGKIRFHIAANRFLRGMVRRTVGTLLMVGKGKISLEEFEDILTNKKKFKLNISAPPQGLYLSEVRYDFI